MLMANKVKKEGERFYQLKHMPPEIWQFLIQEQSKAKIKRNIAQFSIEQTIYKCLKDYMRCREENNFQE